VEALASAEVDTEPEFVEALASVEVDTEPEFVEALESAEQYTGPARRPEELESEAEQCKPEALGSAERKLVLASEADCKLVVELAGILERALPVKQLWPEQVVGLRKPE